MSDTTEQECACCGFDTDCIDGLCQSCNDFNYKLEKLHKQVLNKPITEHPDVQRLIIQVETLSQETKELEAENKRLNSIIAFAVREHKKFKAELKAKDEEIANLKETIRAALRINCLWTTNEAETISEFEDEAKALQMMKTRFEQALKGE